MQRFCSNSSLTSCGLHVDLRGLRLETQATVRRHIREGKKPHTLILEYANKHARTHAIRAVLSIQGFIHSAFVMPLNHLAA